MFFCVPELGVGPRSEELWQQGELSRSNNTIIPFSESSIKTRKLSGGKVAFFASKDFLKLPWFEIHIRLGIHSKADKPGQYEVIGVGTYILQCFGTNVGELQSLPLGNQ